MAYLKIPESIRKGVIQLLELDKPQTEALLKFLQEAEPCLSSRALAGKAEPSVQGVEIETLQEIIHSLVSLSLGPTSSRTNTKKFLADVAASRDLEVDDVSRKRLAALLGKFLGLEKLVITAKAVFVLTEHERVFQDARIVTDVRPLFEKNETLQPGAVVLIHTLKVSYSHAGNPDEFFVAMDSQDLTRLKEVVDRAIRKDRSAKLILRPDVPCMDIIE